MDFSNAGVTEPVDGAFRVHVRWKEKRINRHIYGPRRPDEETAEKDLESMRATATGLGREDGFAAMAAEAKRLCDSKPPKDQGSVTSFREGYAACIQSLEDGVLLRAPPRCARYVPFFGFALSTCPLGCFRARGRQRVAGALSHVSSRTFATVPLPSYPSDEFPLSSLPFGPKTLIDVPFLQLGAIFWKSPGAKKWFQSVFFKFGNANLGPSYV